MAGRKKARKQCCFPVWIEKLDNGYWAMCPAITGCSANGLTYDEVLANMRRKIIHSLEDMEAGGREPRGAGNFSFMILEVAE
jgi:predicted RNase H-like HicB family nuclease